MPPSVAGQGTTSRLREHTLTQHRNVFYRMNDCMYLFLHCADLVPLDTCPVRPCVAPATVASSLQWLLCPSSVSPDPSGADTQGFYFLPDAGAQCNDSAKFSTEQRQMKQQHNIRLIFIIRHYGSDDGSTKTSKRDKYEHFF